MQHFENLKQIEEFMKENAPDWTVERFNGLTSTGRGKHSPTSEALFLYKPGKNKKIFAEFWKGFYSACPETYTGIYDVCYGDLDFGMEEVIKNF